MPYLPAAAVSDAIVWGTFDGFKEVGSGLFSSRECFGGGIISVWPFEGVLWCSFRGEVFLKFGVSVDDGLDYGISFWVVFWAVWIFCQAGAVFGDVLLLEGFRVVCEAVRAYFIVG